MEKELIIKKIRKLLNLQYGAEKIGSDGEAYAAAKLVNKLLMEHNLSLGDITLDENKGKVTIKEGSFISYADKYGTTWKKALLSVICENNLCTILLTPGMKKMNIVGSEENVIIVEEFYKYLVEVFNRLALQRFNELQNEAMKEGKYLPPVFKKKFFTSYLNGIPYGLQENYNQRKPTSEETALVLSHKEVIQEYISGKFGDVKKARSRRPDIDSDMANLGYKDGLNVSLDQQLYDKSPRQQKLIS